MAKVPIQTQLMALKVEFSEITEWKNELLFCRNKNQAPRVRMALNLPLTHFIWSSLKRVVKEMNLTFNQN